MIDSVDCPCVDEKRAVTVPPLFAVPEGEEEKDGALGVADAAYIVAVACGWEGEDVWLAVPQVVGDAVEDDVALPNANPNDGEKGAEGLKSEVKVTPLAPEKVEDKVFPGVLVPVERGKVREGVGELPRVGLSDNVGERAVGEGEDVIDKKTVGDEVTDTLEESVDESVGVKVVEIDGVPVEDDDTN